jgi:YidC/Oxa1 family membrane protein insertase
MEKKTIIAIVLCIAVWLLWSALFVEPPKRAPVDLPADGGTTKAETAVGDGKEAADSGEEKKDQKEEEGKAPAERAEERLARIETERFEAVWSTRGASLKTFRLLEYMDRQPDGSKSENEQENLVSTEDEKSRPFTIRFRAEKTDFKLPKYTDWSLVEEKEDRVVFRFTDPGSEKTPIITKRYTLSKEKNLFDLEVELQNRSESSITEQIVLDTYAGYETVQASGCMGAPRVPRSPVCLVNDELMEVEPKPGTGKTGEPAVLWTGINEQYFLMAAIAMGVDKAVCEVEAGHKGLLTASLMYPEVVIPPGGSVTHRYRLFAGPKRLNLLENVRGGTGNADQDARLDESVDFGWLGFLCHPMLWLLKEFFGLVGNYGIAILFLTIVIKIILLPLTQKSMKSMKEMAKLKPMMDELKKKYGDDKQRLNQEMMALYKSHKINPMGGCFPLLLQMPIWIALYRMLYSAVELYQTSFIPGWIDDLSFRDPYYIMPIVMGASMFLQQRLSPTSADTSQAKMMMYAMPIFFTFIMLYLPSGLVLYIFVNSILSIGHQLVYNKMTAAPAPPAKASKAGS